MDMNNFLKDEVINNRVAGIILKIKNTLQFKIIAIIQGNKEVLRITYAI